MQLGASSNATLFFGYIHTASEGLVVRRALLSAVFLSCSAFHLGCSGSTPSDLYDSSDAGPAAVVTPPEAAVTIMEAGPAEVGSPGDVGSNFLPDAETPPDASVSCSTGVSCKTPSQFCCAFIAPQSNPDTCSTSLSDCSNQGGTTVRCTSSTQCPSGEVCCASTTTTSLYYSDVSCRPTCDPTTTQGNNHQFCDPSVPTDCPSIARCEASTVLNGFYACLLTK